MSDPADLGVVEASGLLARRELSAVELAQACLARIRERDGTHSRDGDPGSINAWIRVYEEDALVTAARADVSLARGGAAVLCGIPIGLKDLYAVAGKPLTASSLLLDEVPTESCDVWKRLEAAGMVLLGHTHTHEFAWGGTTDQVGNPWSLDRTAGGSSGGSGGRARGAHGSRRDRHRHRRLAAYSVRAERHVDDQADARPRVVARRRAALAGARPRRADGAHRRRLRAAPRRDGGRRGPRPARAALARGRPSCDLAADRRPRARRRRRLRRRGRRLSPARRGDRRAVPRAAAARRSSTTGERFCSATRFRSIGGSTIVASSIGRRCASGSRAPRRPP